MMKKLLMLSLSIVMIFSFIAYSSNSMVYENDTYGFRFELPRSWMDNYEIRETLSEGDYPDKLRVDVLFSPEKLDASINKMPLISFIVVEKAYWDEFNPAEYPSMGDYIGEKGEYVILIAGSQSLPYDLDTDEGQMFNEMYKDRVKLTDSFEII